jgi:hypothetical protein
MIQSLVTKRLSLAGVSLLVAGEVLEVLNLGEASNVALTERHNHTEWKEGEQARHILIQRKSASGVNAESLGLTLDASDGVHT